MFSKLIGAIVLILSCSGCGLLGDSMSAPVSAPNNIAQEANCMSESLDTLGQFFSGSVSASAIGGSWQCFEDAVDLFARKVRGANPNYWTARELANFIETQFLDAGEKISDDLMTNIMRIKVLLIGGPNDRINRDEIGALHGLAKALAKLMQDLNPQMTIYSGNWIQSGNHAADKAELGSAEAEFTEKIRASWPVMKGSYDLNTLKSLADSFRASFPTSDRAGGFQTAINKYLALIVVAKKILLNDQSSVIAPAHWPRLMSQLPGLYSRYLFYSYFLDNDDSWFWKTGLADLDQWVHDLIVTLQNVLAVRGAGSPGVTIDELNSLVDGLTPTGFLGDVLTPSGIKALIPVLIKRLLTPPGNRLSGKVETTFSLVSIGAFRTEFETFMTVQKKLDTLINVQPTFTHAQLASAFASPVGVEEEFARITRSPASYAIDDLGRMFINMSGEIPYSAEGLARMNLVRSFVRAGMRAYAMDASRTQSLSHLTKIEVIVDLWNEMRPFLVQAELIEADNLTFAKNRFIEANLFTPVGNGDNNLDFYEAAGIGQMIWSGLKLHSGFADNIKMNCQVPNTNPPVYQVPCAMEKMRQDIPTVATSLPMETVLFQTMSQPSGANMLTQIIKAAGWVPNIANTAKMSDVGLNPHVLQYIEAIYRRWDTNKNGILDKAEAMAAEPTFRPLLSDISGQTDVGTLRAAFAYILIHQKNPADNVFDFFWFMQDEASWAIAVDRPKIASILGFIADQIRAKSAIF